MSYIRDPIYVYGQVSCDLQSCESVHCSECRDIKKSLHEQKWVHQLKYGENADKIAYYHMAEHYRNMIDDLNTENDAILIHSAAWERYLCSIPILGKLINRIRNRFDEKYGFIEE